jgi:hypothetical protein
VLPALPQAPKGDRAFYCLDDAVIAARVLELMRDFILVFNSDAHVGTAPPPPGLSRSRLALFVNAEGVSPAEHSVCLFVLGGGDSQWT